MKSLLFFILFAPIFLVAQTKNESHSLTWVNNLSWQQILKKAKKENKYIFVDCFTTWCGPCKKMDKEVYTNDSVSAVLNDKFISVKVQMDSTKGDDAFTQTWYTTAKKISTTYNITAYPTFLFFSPGGEIVYKDLGFKMPDKFIQTVQDALNPTKQYYALLSAFKKGKKDYVHMPDLIKSAKQLGDTTNYLLLVTDYYAYLQSQGKDKLYTKENIEFIGTTLESPKQLLFKMFYPNGKLVDSIMNKDGYARKVVEHVINKDKANPFLHMAEGKPEPDWNILYNDIAKNYSSEYADRVVLECRLKWHQYYKHVLSYAVLLNDKMEKYGSDTTSMVDDFKFNNQAFAIWKDINDTVQLKRIIGWMGGIVRRGEKATGIYIQYWPYYIDTYANLYYKVGATTEALKWEELAVAKARELKVDKSIQEGIQENYNKMKKGTPTWIFD